MNDYLTQARTITDAISNLLTEPLDEWTKGRMDSKIEAALANAFEEGLKSKECKGKCHD